MTRNGPSRRSFVAGGVVTLLVFGCKKEARCKTCGMKIDPTSAWRAEIVADDGTAFAFDTPRCALQAWRSGRVGKTWRSFRVQEYYDRAFRDAADVRFVAGGDITGPMGPDLVPVDPTRVAKFIQDHGADRAYRLDEVTPEIIAALK